MSQNAALSRPEIFFVAGQLVLGLALLLCLVRIPHYFFTFDQGGVSNYGTEASTKALYVYGFAAATLGTLLAALTLPTTMTHHSQLRLGLWVLAILYLVVLLSTFSYKLSDSLRQLHDDSAIALFVGMLIGAVWLRFTTAQDKATRRAFLVFVLGIVVGAATLFGRIHLLFAVQIVAGVAFAYLLAHGIGVLRKTW